MNARKSIRGRIDQIISRLAANAGFTLIEIMIVVSIMALLTGLVIAPNLMRSWNKSRVEAAKVGIKSFEIPLMEYNNDKGSYPSSDEGLNALVTEGYLKKLPADPWGSPFQYRFPGESDPDSYEIWSMGADKKEGGEGFNADIKSWDEK